jgi:predicted transcriptional regulator
MNDPGNTHSKLLELTSEIVTAFVSNNTIAAGDVPGLISNVFRSLNGLDAAAAEKPAEALTPAVPIKRSIATDYLVCLEDGKRQRTLKRHLASRHNMTPDEYRRRWGLPANYPMVAPAYAAKRSELAKSLGLGRKPALAAPSRAAEPARAGQQPQRRVGGRQRQA